jgi:hypothetical protein
MQQYEPNVVVLLNEREDLEMGGKKNSGYLERENESLKKKIKIK